MSENRYYYYDPETCSFQEAEDKKHRGKYFLVALAMLFFFGSLGYLTYDTFNKHSLIAENNALRSQSKSALNQLYNLQQKVDELQVHDQQIYRTMFQMEGLSDDMLQLGVGGNDTYAEFNEHSESASDLLKETAQLLDKLALQVDLEGASYRQLLEMAGQQETRMAQLPAIMPATGPLVSGFGRRLHPITKVWRQHTGIDILVQTGTEVFTTADGVVDFSGLRSGYGYQVRIKHEVSGYVTSYSHLSRIPKNIRRGTKVTRGQLIALSGSSGLSTAPHLHYEVRSLDGNALNPILFLQPSMTPEEFKKLVDESEVNHTMLDGLLDE